MSLQYSGGVEYPRFIIKNGSATVEEIDLSLTNSGGLVEDTADYTIKRRNIYGTSRNLYQNDLISFTLHYDELLDVDDAMNIEKIRNYEKDGYDIYLMPRTDTPERIKQVVYSGEPFSIGVLTGGQQAPGNRLPILRWDTKGLTRTNWINPNNIVYGSSNFIAAI